jgi:hypothetical protein
MWAHIPIIICLTNSTNCNCWTLFIPDARSELKALLWRTTTSVTRGASFCAGDSGVSAKSVVGMCEESATLGCLEDLLTEREERFLRRVSMAGFAVCEGN